MLGIYLTTGYPDIESTKKALRLLDDQEIDLIELGVPFSDPLADGPVIQKASYEAIKNGVNLEKIFALVKELRDKGFKKPRKGIDNLILFSYFNPLFNFGFDKLIAECKRTGVRGVLIPDLPLEEATELCRKFKANNLDLILLIAITSPKERIKKIAELSEPWIYLVSRTGVTGSREDINSLQTSNNEEDQENRVREIISLIRNETDKKIGLGFGIDSKDKVSNAFKLGADMAIIGTKSVKLLADEGIDSFGNFINKIK